MKNQQLCVDCANEVFGFGLVPDGVIVKSPLECERCSWEAHDFLNEMCDLSRDDERKLIENECCLG